LAKSSLLVDHCQFGYIMKLTKKRKKKVLTEREKEFEPKFEKNHQTSSIHDSSMV
jgi:UDP-N-acetylglucosamine transferase subunit ALG13